MSGRDANWRVIRKASSGEILLARARWCADFWCKFKGLMLRAALPPEEGLLFVCARESRTDTAIHMLFMRFSIAVIWLDAGGTVVDTALAKPWRLVYTPQKAAQYFIEAGPDLLARVAVGERLTFDEAAEETASS